MNHLRSPGQQRRRRGLPVRRPVATSAAAAAFETAPFAAYLAATLLAVTIILALATGPAHAAIGIGTSPAATVDTVRPVLNLDALPEHLLVAGGQNVTFHWTSSDDHPGTTAADFTAQVRDGATPLAAIDYLATADDTTWDYQVPDISSGYLNVLVTCRDAFGNTTTAQSAEFSVVLSTSDVPVAGLPDRPVLEGNQPNPCNPGTTVRFSLPEAQTAVLELYAANGARVRRLVDGGFEAGQHEVFWDGRDDHGRAVASGTYLLRLTAGNVQQARKLALVR